MSFLGKYVVLPLVAMLTGYVLFVTHTNFIGPYLSREPVKAPEVRWTEEQRSCLVTHVADDGHTQKQHIFMAHAILNLSEQKDNMSICRIHREKLTLSAPSEEGTKSERYPEAANWFERLPVIGDKANYAQAEIDVDHVLKYRRDDYATQPCLAVITRYIRPAKWGTYQNEGKMRKEMGEPLYDDGQGAKFFGPKGSTAKCA